MKIAGLLGTPPTITTTGPVVTPFGTATEMLVALQHVEHGVAGVPLNVTVLDPCDAPKFAPLIVTVVPMGPEIGERLVMPGPDPAAKATPLLCAPDTVTTMFPAVAPLGTGTVIPVALQHVGHGVANVPLNVIVLVPCAVPKLVPAIVTEVPAAPD